MNHWIAKSVVAAIAATGILGAAAQGAVVANWTIETAPPANLSDSSVGPAVAADAGAGTLTGVHASTATDWSTPVGNGSFNSYSSNEWAIGDYYQFQVSTAGLDDIWIQWDQTRSSTGPGTFDLQYSTDGTNFTTFLDNYTVPAISWSSSTPDATGTTSFVADTTGVTALDNQASVYFRLVADAAPSSNFGTNRIDNIVINSGPIPEPSALALLGLASLATFARRRRA